MRGSLKDAYRLLNDEVIISNKVKSAKQIRETFNYIRKWKQIQKVSNGLKFGKEESIGDIK